MRINANTVSLDLVVSLRTEMPCLLVLIFLTVLESLPVDVTCVKLADIYWNSSNPMFRIDNTDHIIDVNKNNVPYEYDQVNIICPGYTPGTHEEDPEKYIIYNVSKDEYDMCTITGSSPRIIAVCDKPHRLMYFTITFRPFTPQPGGLEFRPGQDYYFISTSSKDSLTNRIGGRCMTHNMRVIFKVCCNPSVKSSTLWTTSTTTSTSTTVSSLTPTFGPGVTRHRPYIPTTPRTPRTTTTTKIPSTPPDFKSLPGGFGGGGGSAGSGSSSSSSSAENTRGKHGSGKKTPGDNKDKHPNETGMKIEELVRNSGSHPRTLSHHRWTTTLVTLLAMMASVLLAR